MFLSLVIFILAFSSASSIALQCHFHDSSWGYKCTDNVTQITARGDRTVADIIGAHNEEKSHDNVLVFSAFKTKIFYFPKELTTSFPNLKYISIKSCGLRELSCRDLEQFGEKLTYLWLCNNDIEIIERNLFKNNPNLAILNLIGNKIKFVEHGAIGELAYPHSLYLKNNPCYSGSISYDEEGLPDFVTEIEEKCTFGGIRAQFYELKDTNEALEGKIEKLENEISELKRKIADCEIIEHSGSGDQEN